MSDKVDNQCVDCKAHPATLPTPTCTDATAIGSSSNVTSGGAALTRVVTCKNGTIEIDSASGIPNEAPEFTVDVVDAVRALEKGHSWAFSVPEYKDYSDAIVMSRRYNIAITGTATIHYLVPDYISEAQKERVHQALLIAAFADRDPCDIIAARLPAMTLVNLVLMRPDEFPTTLVEVARNVTLGEKPKTNALTTLVMGMVYCVPHILLDRYAADVKNEKIKVFYNEYVRRGYLELAPYLEYIASCRDRIESSAYVTLFKMVMRPSDYSVVRQMHCW